MLFRVLADIIILVHLLWILFLIGGAYWGRKNGVVMFGPGGGAYLRSYQPDFGLVLSSHTP